MAFMTALAIGSAIAGTAMNAIGSVKSGNAAARAAESEAQRDEYNAQVAELQAEDAVTRGAEEESRFRTGVRKLIGSQRAGFAGQGVAVGSGSAADVQADAAYLGELDARQIRANAQRQAWGFSVQAEDLRMAADVARKGGASAKSAGRWGAATSILGGGSSLLMSRYGLDRNVMRQAPASGGGHSGAGLGAG
jgi:hypothetical protein